MNVHSTSSYVYFYPTLVEKVMCFEELVCEVSEGLPITDSLHGEHVKLPAVHLLQVLSQRCRPLQGIWLGIPTHAAAIKIV